MDVIEIELRAARADWERLADSWPASGPQRMAHMLIEQGALARLMACEAAAQWMDDYCAAEVATW